MHTVLVFVMKKGFAKILALTSGLLFSIIVPAQDLPLLPADPAVNVSTMPDGLRCYIISNASHKDLADFALVQKIDADDDACAVLDSLPRLAGQSPKSFLTRRGSRPGRNGFVQIREDAVIYHFRDVEVSDKAAVDSTLLLIMDIVDNTYSPADQAIVVSGDINASSVHATIRSMSFMIPYEPAAEHKEHVWSGGPRTDVRQETDPRTGLTTITVEWASPRTPEKYMGTVQKAIYDKAVHELGYILESRVETMLRNADVPVADISFRHRGSLDGPSDELFLLSVTVEEDDAGKAFEAMTAVMSSVDAGNVSVEELRQAERGCFNELSGSVDKVIRNNDEYVDRCIKAYLYNGSLASEKERMAFYMSKEISDESRMRMFTGIASALLDTDVSGHASGLDAVRYNVSDTLALPGVGPKVKLKSSKKDHFSGGTSWVFSNGFKVVYKRMDTGGRMFYAMCMNGGFGSVDGLSEGEGAFMSDYIDLCHISGLKGRNFREMLSVAGVEMDVAVNLSNVMLSGKAERGKTGLLLRSLLAVANERTAADSASYDYYRRCEEARIGFEKYTPASMMVEMDSLMCPGYRYSTYRSSGKLTDRTMLKAEDLFDGLASKMNDGVLVLAGDMPEGDLRKLLLQYVGAFRTKDVAFRRTTVQYQPVSGRSSVRREGPSDAMVVAMSADMPMTSGNVYAARIATRVLRQHLVRSFADEGINVEVSEALRLYPEERYSIMLTAGGEDVGNEELWKLRREVSCLTQDGPSEAAVTVAKEYLKNRYALEMKDPVYWVYAMALRHLDGKDFTTGYAAKIDAVTPEMVRVVIERLDKGTRLEYMIEEKK